MQSRARTDKGRYCDYHSYRFYFDVGARWVAWRMSLLQARYSVMENEGEKALVAQGSTQVIPVLPLRDVVVYPHMVIPLFVGRENPYTPWKRPWRVRRKYCWWRSAAPRWMPLSLTTSMSLVRSPASYTS